MTRDEINSKISELRGYRRPPAHCCGASGFNISLGDVCEACIESTRYNSLAYALKFKPNENRDWLWDCNWPTLLRELAGKILSPAPLIYNDGPDKAPYACSPAMIYCPTLEEAVCLAWIEWKTS